MELNLNEQELNRRNALVQMRELGIEPYPAAMYPVNATTEDIRERSEEKINEISYIFIKIR